VKACSKHSLGHLRNRDRDVKLSRRFVCCLPSRRGGPISDCGAGLRDLAENEGDFVRVAGMAYREAFGRRDTSDPIKLIAVAVTRFFGPDGRCRRCGPLASMALKDMVFPRPDDGAVIPQARHVRERVVQLNLRWQCYVAPRDTVPVLDKAEERRFERAACRVCRDLTVADRRAGGRRGA
jgi:hypothetical protein